MTDAKLTLTPREIYMEAQSQWGRASQVPAAIEELSELIAALSRNMNGKDNDHDVTEELADAAIVLEQMALYFDRDEIDDWRRFKLCRLAERLKMVPACYVASIDEPARSPE